jgi:four helix bundle protein
MPAFAGMTRFLCEPNFEIGSRYFDIALGSLNETVAGVDVLVDNGFTTKNQFAAVIQHAENVAKQLGGFKKKLL